MANYPPASTPKWEKWERMEDEFIVVGGPIYADGGQDTFSPGASAVVLRWHVRFSGLLVAEADVLDVWNTANRGGHLSYTYTFRDGTVYNFVKTESFKRGHSKLYANSQWREIVFVKRP